MLILVVGGSSSGKSEIGENIAVKYGANSDKKLYIATMQPFDEECLARIAKHRRARMDKDFATLECYQNFAEIAIPQSYDVVLLECLTNLLANEMYGGDGDAFSNILAGLERVSKMAVTTVVVSGDVACDGCSVSDETLQYIDCLGALNVAIAAKADVVIEAVCGLAIVHKGGEIYEKCF